MPSDSERINRRASPWCAKSASFCSDADWSRPTFVEKQCNTLNGQRMQATSASVKKEQNLPRLQHEPGDAERLFLTRFQRRQNQTSSRLRSQTAPPWLSAACRTIAPDERRPRYGPHSYSCSDSRQKKYESRHRGTRGGGRVHHAYDT
jgi:hypothetical protein